MTRETQGTVILIVGLVVARLTLEGGYQSYVKSGLYWPLLLSAVLLVAVGGWTMWQSRGSAATVAPEAEADAHGPAGHDGHRERVGWLLLVPIAVLLLVAPSPLGAFAAERGSANRVTEVEGAGFDPLPEPREGAVDMTFQETVVRTFYADEDAIRGVPVRLTGFVVPDDAAPGQYRLTRFVVGCCAADGSPLQVLVTTSDPIPPADTWVEVVAAWDGSFVETGLSRLPVMEQHSLREVDEPDQPYEY